MNDKGIHICKSMLAYKRWGKHSTPKKIGMKPDHFVGKYYVTYGKHENNLKQEVKAEINELELEKKKPKKVFVEGPISPEKIANSIANHQVKTNIGAHDIFLGQVRADEINGKTVSAINYSAHEEMAENIFYEIRETAFEKYNLTCMHIYHSLGLVKAGEICLFVFNSFEFFFLS